MNQSGVKSIQVFARLVRCASKPHCRLIYVRYYICQTIFYSAAFVPRGGGGT